MSSMIEPGHERKRQSAADVSIGHTGGHERACQQIDGAAHGAARTALPRLPVDVRAEARFTGRCRGREDRVQSPVLQLRVGDGGRGGLSTTGLGRWRCWLCRPPTDLWLYRAANQRLGRLAHCRLPGDHRQHPLLSPSRVGQHVAIGMATERGVNHPAQELAAKPAWWNLSAAGPKCVPPWPFRRSTHSGTDCAASASSVRLLNPHDRAAQAPVLS